MLAKSRKAEHMNVSVASSGDICIVLRLHRQVRLMEEENNAIRKVVGCQLIQKTLPLHQNILLAMQYFAILRDRGESKIKQ